MKRETMEADTTNTRLLIDYLVIQWAKKFGLSTNVLYRSLYRGFGRLQKVSVHQLAGKHKTSRLKALAREGLLDQFHIYIIENGEEAARNIRRCIPTE